MLIERGEPHEAASAFHRPILGNVLPDLKLEWPCRDNSWHGRPTIEPTFPPESHVAFRLAPSPVQYPTHLSGGADHYFPGETASGEQRTSAFDGPGLGLIFFPAGGPKDFWVTLHTGSFPPPHGNAVPIGAPHAAAAFPGTSDARWCPTILPGSTLLAGAPWSIPQDGRNG